MDADTVSSMPRRSADDELDFDHLLDEIEEARWFATDEPRPPVAIAVGSSTPCNGASGTLGAPMYVRPLQDVSCGSTKPQTQPGVPQLVQPSSASYPSASKLPANGASSAASSEEQPGGEEARSSNSTKKSSVKPCVDACERSPSFSTLTGVEQALVRRLAGVMSVSGIPLAELKGHMTNSMWSDLKKYEKGLRRFLLKHHEIFELRQNAGQEIVKVYGADSSEKSSDPPSPPLTASESTQASMGDCPFAERSGSEDADDREDDFFLTLLFRGLPYRAAEQDILKFLGPHQANLSRDVHAVKLVTNRDGRPSGFASVRLCSYPAAKAALQDLHLKRMGDRYIEVFRRKERSRRVQNTDDVAGLAKAAQGTAAEQVVQECTTFLDGRPNVLLSMLGVALGGQSRAYLKKQNIGLKQFLLGRPEFKIEGPKGAERVVLAEGCPGLNADCSDDWWGMSLPPGLDSAWSSPVPESTSVERALGLPFDLKTEDALGLPSSASSEDALAPSDPDSKCSSKPVVHLSSYIDHMFDEESVLPLQMAQDPCAFMPPYWDSSTMNPYESWAPAMPAWTWPAPPALQGEAPGYWTCTV